MDLEIVVNLEEIAQKFNRAQSSIESRVKEEIRKLSITSHAFVVNYANEKLSENKRGLFFGKDGKNVRWIEISDGFYVVEIDPSAKFIEEGRPETFMGEWLLKPGAPGVKRAKDGSWYRAIPIGQARGVGGQKENKEPVLQAMIKGALRREGISLKRLEKDEQGKPKIGVLHKLDIKIAHRTDDHNRFFSKPRSPEIARQIGLKAHEGIFHLHKAVVVQRHIKDGNGKSKVAKEVVTFRTISSKHKAEHRWFSKEIKPLDSIPAAHQYALSEWDKVVKQLEEEFRQEF